MCTSNRDYHKLENTVKQSRFKHLGELHEEWTEAGVSTSRVTTLFRKRATKPLLKQKHRQKHLTWVKEKKNWTIVQWSKVLFSDESQFCISFENQGPRVWRKRGETQNPCCLKSSVKFPQSVMIWAAMSSAGVGPLCSCGSVVVHCVSSAKGCGFNSQGTHILKKCIVWMHCKSLWIKASAKCINVNVFWSPVNAAIYQDILEHFCWPAF